MDGNYSVVYFDSDCAVCNYFVLWFLKNETERSKLLIKFSPLKSELASKMIPYHIQKLDTVVFYHDRKFHIYSDVLVCLAPYLKSRWSWIILLKYVPRFLRNFSYKLFAIYRKQIFKPINGCSITQSAEYRERILN